MMAEFFSFLLSMFADLVGLYFDLPFMDNFSLGDILVAIAVLGVVASALIGQLRSFNLAPEALSSDADYGFDFNYARAKRHYSKEMGDEMWLL